MSYKQPTSETKKTYAIGISIAIVGFILFVSAVVNGCFAQKFEKEIGINTGIAVPFTDAQGTVGTGSQRNPVKDFNGSDVAPLFSLHGGISVDSWHIALQYSHTHLSADDSRINDRGGNEHYRFIRGKRFSTPIDQMLLVVKKDFFSNFFTTAGAGCIRFINYKDHVIYLPVGYYGCGLYATLSDNVRLEMIGNCTIWYKDKEIDGLDERDAATGKRYSKANDCYCGFSIGIVLTGLFRRDILRCYKF